MSDKHKDMPDDDAFAAFLSGEDALSQELRAMQQPAPTAELDAAIREQARQAVAGAARPVAANDAPSMASAGQPATQQHFHPLRTRWRIPVAMAASVVAGVLAHQAWLASGGQSQGVAEQAMVMAPVQSPPAEADKANVDTAYPPEPKRLLPPVEARIVREPLAELAPVEVSAPMPSTAGAQSSQDMPARMSAPKAAAPPPPPLPSPAPAPAPAPSPVEAPPTEAKAAAPVAASEVGYASPEPQAGMPVPAKAPASLAKRKDSVASGAAELGRSDSANVEEREWLKRIDTLLKVGDQKTALEEWDRFKLRFPGYPVEQGMRAKMEAIKRGK